MNEFDKVKVIKAAERVLEAIRIEQELIASKPVGLFWYLLGQKKYNERTSFYHRRRQKASAEIALFKASHCVTTVVYLGDDEVDAIKECWK